VYGDNMAEDEKLKNKIITLTQETYDKTKHALLLSTLGEVLKKGFPFKTAILIMT
jgi:predicted transcriptional regulator